MSWLDEMAPRIERYKAEQDCRFRRNGSYHEHYRSKDCPYGYCRVDVCDHCGKIDSAMGPVGCPCDLTPGWKSHYLDGMGKPRVPVLAKGKKTSRVQRSIKRHDISGYAWLNAQDV